MYDIEFQRQLDEKMDKIIELLETEGKHKKMWEKFKAMCIRCSLINILKDMDRIETEVEAEMED